MVGIIITGHGNFAKALLESSEMIFGHQKNVFAVTLSPNEGPDDLRKKLFEAIDSMNDVSEIIFLVDLRGGTPFNQASSIVRENEKFSLIAGVNLPMVIEALSVYDTFDKSVDVLKDVFKVSKDAIKTIPESLVIEEKDENDKNSNLKSSIPEGTVIGDGKIKFVLARIDTRLLHGQVATSWTKSTNPDRIIVVSDNVAHDKLRKQMIIEAAPSGVKAHVVPIKKMIEVSKDPRFGNTRAMLLFENPSDALETIKGGVNIETLNLGSIAHSAGKAYLTQSVAMGKEDVLAFEEIKKLGVKIDVRKVPTEKGENFDNIMKKAKEELNMN